VYGADSGLFTASRKSSRSSRRLKIEMWSICEDNGDFLMATSSGDDECNVADNSGHDDDDDDGDDGDDDDDGDECNIQLLMKMVTLCSKCCSLLAYSQIVVHKSNSYLIVIN
jgi:hypothetical protein